MTDDKNRVDEDLPYLKQYQSGNEVQKIRASRYIIDKYTHLMTDRIIRNWRVDRATADECVNEIWAQVFSKLDKFDERSLFLTWLYRVSHNYTIDFFRKAQNKPMLTTLYRDSIKDIGVVQYTAKCDSDLHWDDYEYPCDPNDALDSLATDPEDNSLSEQREDFMISILEDVYDLLTPLQKRVFMLDMQGFGSKAIADELGIFPESVSSRKQQINIKIRELLNHENIDS